MSPRQEKRWITYHLKKQMSETNPDSVLSRISEGEGEKAILMAKELTHTLKIKLCGLCLVLQPTTILTAFNINPKQGIWRIWRNCEACAGKTKQNPMAKTVKGSKYNFTVQ